jgi:hypothetical protein
MLNLKFTIQKLICPKYSKFVCPRCELPYEGINECEYCGLVFDKKTKLKAKKLKAKLKSVNR